MEPVSAFIQVNKKSKKDDVLFAVFKTPIESDSLTYAPLKNFSDSFGWKDEVKKILEGDFDEPLELWETPCFIYACGYVDRDEIAMTFAIEWGEGIFAVAETLHIEDNVIFLGMVSFWYGDEEITNPDDPIENLEIPLGKSSIEKIKNIEKIFNETVVYSGQGDDLAVFRLNGPRAVVLDGYEKIDQSTWVRNWDDLDDLASISIAWRLALNFDD